MKNIVFFNLAVMPYHVPIFKELISKGYIIHVFWYAAAPKTSYRMPNLLNVNLYNRFSFTKKSDFIQFINRLSPELIVCSGWTDDLYNHTCAYYKLKNIPTIVISDTQWRGGKQWFNVFTSWFRHKKYFSYFFAAGILQYEYARKLGFNPHQILMNSLSADTTLFLTADIEQKKKLYPKKFLFVGRFVPEKALDILLEAWKRLEDKHGWILELVGEGALLNDALSIDGLIVKDFMSQKDLVLEAQNSGCFVLPSRFEQWSLAIHEFSSAGLPLLCSRNCGAIYHFLIDGYNGYSFDPNNIDSLVNALKQIINHSDEDLIKMSYRSREISKRINPEIVASTLISILKN